MAEEEVKLMSRVTKRYRVLAAELNDPIEIIERVKKLTAWLSQEENWTVKRNIGISIKVLMERLTELIQEGGEQR